MKFLLMWLAWQERNNHIFEDNEISLDILKHALFGNLFQWACIWRLSQCTSISAFYNMLALALELFVFSFYCLSKKSN